MSTQLFSLEGKVAVVTGASRGIGRAIALGLARAGAAVAVAARTSHDLEALSEEIESLGARALAVPTDVTDRGQVETLFEQTLERWSALDILVNNAGGTRFTAPLVGVRPDGWDKVMRLNLDAVFHATQLAARHMAELGGGSTSRWFPWPEWPEPRACRSTRPPKAR
jgi:NAD(P)-dependent dehydrogenase (short-subunit alcohol dehydrogenase family)